MIPAFMFSVENPEAVFQGWRSVQSDEEEDWGSIKEENNIDYLKNSVYLSVCIRNSEGNSIKGKKKYSNYPSGDFFTDRHNKSSCLWKSLTIIWVYIPQRAS